MVFTFLAAKGLKIGRSLVETDLIPDVKILLERADNLGVKIILPEDIVVAREFDATAIASIVGSQNIPDDQMGLDIGPNSAVNFATEIKKCKTVFWNGPMGVFEFPNFANGTKVVAKALTEVDGMTVVGGGDSAAAVRKLGFNDNEFGYISTGGGASLEYLEGKELPGLVALS
jgi:phosphoglycerate kinase